MSSTRLFGRSVITLAHLIGFALGAGSTTIAAGMLGSSIFRDVAKGSFYDEAIGEMYQTGIIKGYTANTFGPNDYVTRGQLAVLFSRLRAEIRGELPPPDQQQQSSSQPAQESSSETPASVARSRRASSSKSSAASSSTVPTSNAKGIIRFTTTAFTIPEIRDSFSVAILRTSGTEGPVTVSFDVSGGTATSGSDYTTTNGTVSFANGETSKTLTIHLKDDTVAEGNETVNITLRNPTGGASLGVPSMATLTITDNEAPSSAGANTSSNKSGAASAGANTPTIQWSALTYIVGEHEGSITLTAQRTGSTSASVNVNYATSNGTATSGDYTATSGTLTFAAGETSKTISVPVANDTTIDGNKTFNVVLSSPTGGAVLGSVSTAGITIFDDESATFGSGSLKLSKATYEADESSGKLTVTVMRVGGAKGSVSVNYSTSSGTASSGTDFTNTSGTMTFLPGEASKTFDIPLIKDTTAETGEQFYVDISNPTNGVQLINPTNATVTMND